MGFASYYIDFIKFKLGEVIRGITSIFGEGKFCDVCIEFDQ